MNKLKRKTTINTFLLGFAFLGFLSHLKTQSNLSKVDSLEFVLQNAVEDTSKMNALNDLANITMDSEVESSKQYAVQYLQLAENSSDTYRTADSYLLLSSIYYRIGNIDSMEILAQKALDLLDHPEEENLIYIEMKAYSRLGIVAYKKGDLETSLKYLQKAGSRMTDESDIAGNQFNIGILSETLGDFEGALEAYFKYREFAIKTGNKRSESIALNNIGVAYKNMDEIEKANSYYQKSLKLKEEIGDEHGALMVLEDIAKLCEKTDLKKALSLFESLLKKSESLDNERHIIGALIGLMRLNNLLGNFEKSLTYREKSY